MTPKELCEKYPEVAGAFVESMVAWFGVGLLIGLFIAIVVS